MRGDFPFFAILPIIMLAITFITSVLFMAWQQVTPVINASMNQVNAPQQYHQAYMSVGNNLYTFDMYLAFIFFALLLASIASTVFLSSNPIAWLLEKSWLLLSASGAESAAEALRGAALGP